MSEGRDARVRVVRCGDHAIDHEGSTLRIVYRGGGVTRTIRAVLAVLALPAAAGGIAVVGDELRVGFVAIGVAVLLVASVYGLSVVERRREAGPGVTLLVIDLDRKLLLAPGGEVIAPLSSVWTRRALQVASSSSALRLHWPGRSIIVARGNPFSSSVSGFEAVLERHGVRRG